ncbi:MAG: hypothetical protein R2773_01980 [Flavobacteriaceae bacterium]
MKKQMATYWLFLLVIAIGLFYAFKHGNQAKKELEAHQQNKPLMEQNRYTDLRKMALTVTAKQLGINIPEDSIKVYGIVTDLAIDGGTATVVTYLTGDTSLYLSSGGVFIGAGQHESVKKVTQAFVDSGHLISFKGTPYSNLDLPAEGYAHFYFLSNKGNTRITENIAAMENGQSEYAQLFTDLNEVITQIRLKSPQ